MPRFSISLGRRKLSVTEDDIQHDQITEPSFRVLERTEVVSNKSFDGGARMMRAAQTFPQQVRVQEVVLEDNMFADLKTNRYVALRGI
jgi:hypothetical protein